MSNNLITVYIVSKNYGSFVEKSIKSVLDQTYKNWELFLVNDCSKDNTKKIFQKYKKYAKKIINLKKDTGLQKISNEILKLSNGEFIIRLDADDWFHAEALSCMINKFQGKKNCGAVYSGYYYVDANNKVIGIETNLDTIDSGQNFPPHGACTLFKTRSLKQVGGYSQNLKAQDGWDIWMKLKSKVNFTKINLPLFYYRKHGNSLSDNYKKIVKERGKIFKRIFSKKGDYIPKVLAVIPIKKDFSDFKNVPFKKYKNRTLMDHMISSVEKSKYVNNVVVSTTDKIIEKYFFNKTKFSKKKYYLHSRNKKYDTTIHQKYDNLLVEASDFFKKIEGYKPDILVLLNLHVISNDKSQIDKAINILLENNKDTIFSVIREKDPVFTLEKSKLKILNKGRFDNLDYNNEIILKFNSSLIITWEEILRNKGLFDGDLGFMESLDKDIKKVL